MTLLELLKALVEQAGDTTLYVNVLNSADGREYEIAPDGIEVVEGTDVDPIIRITLLPDPI